MMLLGNIWHIAMEYGVSFMEDQECQVTAIVIWKRAWYAERVHPTPTTPHHTPVGDRQRSVMGGLGPIRPTGRDPAPQSRDQ